MCENLWQETSLMREQTLRGAVFCLLLGEIVDKEGGCSIFQHLPIQTVSYRFLSCWLRQINLSIHLFQMVQFQLNVHLKKKKINDLGRSTFLDWESVVERYQGSHFWNETQISWQEMPQKRGLQITDKCSAGVRLVQNGLGVFCWGSVCNLL